MGQSAEFGMRSAESLTTKQRSNKERPEQLSSFVPWLLSRPVFAFCFPAFRFSACVNMLALKQKPVAD
jgi:hypothetical protein